MPDVALASTLHFLLLGGTAIAAVAIAIFLYRMQRSLDAAPYLRPAPPEFTSSARVAVIVPAYNEAVNIGDCAASILASQLPAGVTLTLWLADDGSSDRTPEIAAELAVADPRVRVLAVPPRPQDDVWVGKNWACAQAADRATGDFLLFVDADVRLAPGAIAAALAEMERTGADLLSAAPGIDCGCLAEWLVQPLIMALIAVGFDFASVNDPANPKAFAAGPFMLFRRESYVAIGGHRAVAAHPVEDVMLAQRIKDSGKTLHYALGLGLISARMYRSFAALWEGWTKNYYLGSGRRPGNTLFSALAVLLVFTVPWLSAAIALAESWQAPGRAFPLLVLSGMAIALQYALRAIAAVRFQQPLRYVWLSWLGGLLVAAIAVVSIVKTETGWGWTWRGRSLAVARAVLDRAQP